MRANEAGIDLQTLAIRLYDYQRRIERIVSERVAEVGPLDRSVTSQYKMGQINAYSNALLWLREVVRTDDLYQSLRG